MKSTINLQELPKFRDGMSYFYTEHARVEQQDSSIACYTLNGVIQVPVAQLSLLQLGPGTSISHAAIKTLAQNGCLVQWLGEEGVRYYGTGLGETRSSQHLEKQAECFVNPEKHLRTVRRLYQMRFPEKLPENLTLEQIRGFEGVRVRNAYQQASKETGVAWSGRSYKRDNWKDSDPINRAISTGNACLYGLCHSAIISAGYTPGLGFIHVGKQLSFVYDIADLYKLQTVIPIAFHTVKDSEQNLEMRMRLKLRDRFKETRLLEYIVRDLHLIFEEEESEDLYARDFALPGSLWDIHGEVEGGVSYGGDGAGESPETPER